MITNVSVCMNKKQFYCAILSNKNNDEFPITFQYFVKRKIENSNFK